MHILKEAAKLMNPIIKTSPKPILNNVHLTLKDDRLRLFGTDLAEALQIDISLEGDDFDTTVNFKAFDKLLKMTKTPSLQLRDKLIVEDDGQVIGSLDTTASDEMPSLSVINLKYQDATSVSRYLSEAVNYIGKEHRTFAIDRIFIDTDAIVATDGNRLYHAKLPITLGDAFIPATKFIKRFAVTSQQIALNDTYFSLQREGEITWTYMSRNAEGEFPDYKLTFPDYGVSYPLNYDAHYVHKQAKRFTFKNPDYRKGSSVPEYKPVLLTVNGDIQIESYQFETTPIMIGETKSDTCHCIGVNPVYLFEALSDGMKAVAMDRADMPIELKRDNVTVLIMPVEIE